MSVSLQPGGVEGLVFDNRFVRELPGDPETGNRQRQVRGACYSYVRPTQAANPRLLAWSREMADQLGLDEKACRSSLFTEVFSGNRVLEDMQPFAMCYGGHQFGNWAGQLGDGRAINLGEVVNQAGERFTLQLKGAGQTPYSRTADGLAVLRSSLREFLCSEAMYHLGVPTTRALSLILSGEEVVRDMFYDGNPKLEPGAIVCRVAPSFLRFGNFQIFAANGETAELQALLDYTIKTDFPHLGEPSREVYLRWLEEVCERTARLMVEWQRVGFVHGVMNTDNMSILGLTIDYGPYGWLDNFDFDWTPNTTDAQGRRYRFGNQPQIALWNLVQLANALYPLFDDAAPLEEALDSYSRVYKSEWESMMAGKLGFQQFAGETDQNLVRGLMELFALVETDMTLFFRQLAEVDAGIEDISTVDNQTLAAPLQEAFYVEEGLNEECMQTLGNWLRRYIERLQKDNLDNASRKTAMDRVNPKYVLRNYMAQMAIDKCEEGDPSLLHELHELLRRPYDAQPDMEDSYYRKRPDWARQRAGCSMLSCSS